MLNWGNLKKIIHGKYRDIKFEKEATEIGERIILQKWPRRRLMRD